MLNPPTMEECLKQETRKDDVYPYRVFFIKRFTSGLMAGLHVPCSLGACSLSDAWEYARNIRKQGFKKGYFVDGFQVKATGTK